MWDSVKYIHGAHPKKKKRGKGKTELDLVHHAQVFVPHVHDEAISSEEAGSWTWPVRLFYIVMSLTIGWPLYLIFNVASRHYDGWANHFLPSSPIFNENQRPYVILSDIGILSALGEPGTFKFQSPRLSLFPPGFIFSLKNLCAVIWCGAGASYYVAYTHGLSWLMASYGIPYLIVNMWLVLITQMQHTHPKLPHYRGAEWDWLRGALATVDRDYGLLNYVFHRITDTHVVHHLFSRMPFYHAAEATEAIKPILGKYYMRDDRNIWEALGKVRRRLMAGEIAKAGGSVNDYGNLLFSCAGL